MKQCPASLQGCSRLRSTQQAGQQRVRSQSPNLAPLVRQDSQKVVRQGGGAAFRQLKCPAEACTAVLSHCSGRHCRYVEQAIRQFQSISAHTDQGL